MRLFVVCLGAAALLFQLSGCTPLVIGGAAAGGAYVGYKLKEEGYSINITKEVKGKQVDNQTDTKQGKN